MTITKFINGKEAVIKVDGWLDTQSAPELRAEIERLSDNIRNILFDFTKLDYISSAGIRTIIIAHSKVNGNLIIKNASNRIMGLFKTLGLQKIARFI